VGTTSYDLSVYHELVFCQNSWVDRAEKVLHPHLRHCSFAAFLVRQLPSAVHTVTLAFDVRLLGLSVAGVATWRLLPDYLRNPSRSFGGFHQDTHTHPFNGPLSGTTQVSQYQKGKTNLDFTEARDSEWQWN